VGQILCQATVWLPNEPPSFERPVLNSTAFLPVLRPPLAAPKNSVKTICSHKIVCYWCRFSLRSRSRTYYGVLHTTVHPKIYWYLNTLHVSGLESPLQKRCNRCLIQHLMTGASDYVQRCCRSIRANIAPDKTRSGPVVLPCLERILWPRRVEGVMLSLFCIRL